MRNKLPKAAKATLRKASREAVEESFSFLKRHFKHSRWVGTSNRYRRNTTGRIYADTRPGRSLNYLHLTQYIAASAPLHCADGWSLLGRAIDCHARRRIMMQLAILRIMQNFERRFPSSQRKALRFSIRTTLWSKNSSNAVSWRKNTPSYLASTRVLGGTETLVRSSWRQYSG